VARPVGMAVAVLGALLLLVWPVAHPVQAQARLEGRIQHALAAPADGFLREVQVRPGDAVKAGQTLLRLDGEDLSLQLRQLDAELAGEDAQLGDALQRGDRIRLALASARVGELQARRQGLAQQLARAELKAPFDGVVIAGDVVARLGAPVQRGETLLTLAPADGLRAIVEVSDSDIAKVAVGQAGQLVLAARPNSSLAVAVTRLTPLATAGGGRNWFEAEVTLQPQVAAAGAASGLLPGMRGIARLEGGTAPRAWHWAQAGWGQLRLALFRWWP
jgi:multidrug resistance efflux pump